MDNTNNIEQPASNDSKVISFGLTVIFLVFVVVGGWMSVAPLASASVAVGKVSADSQKKTIQHLEGGIVEKIFVKDGDKVEEGDLLIQLNDTQIHAQLDIPLNQFYEALALESRLKSQRDNLSNIKFHEDLLSVNDNQNVKNAINGQSRVFESRKKIIISEELIGKQRVSQTQRQIEGLNFVLESKKTRLISIEEEIEEWKELFREQLVDKQRLRELQREKTLVEGDIASSQAQVMQMEVQISELKSQDLFRKKEFLNTVLSELVQTQTNISDLKSKILASKDKLNRTKIIAPISGTVVGMDIHTQGGIIGPSQAVLDIIPSGSELLVIAQMQTTDVDKVHVGLLSDIRFSAFDLQQAHVVEGKVIHVSADSMIDEVTGSPYYEVKIELTPKGTKQLKEYNFNLVSGMPAEVMIKIGDRTALSYLVKPFTDMLARSFNEE